MLSNLVAAAEHPAHHDERADAAEDNAQVIGELVHHVEGDEARLRGEKQAGHDGHDGAGVESSLLSRDTELISDASEDDLHNRNHRGDTSQEKRAEEEEAEKPTKRHGVDDRREGDERQANTGGDYLVDAHALLCGHKAQCREDADASEDLEGGVRESRDQTRVRDVSTRLEVGRVGHHDAETDGQREENLAVSGDPHGRVSEHRPVRREESIETVHGPIEEECAHHEHDEHDCEDRQEDGRELADALVDIRRKSRDADDPDEDHNEQNRPDELRRVIHRGVCLEEVTHEVLIWLIAPALIEGLDGVDGCPRDDGSVVDGNEEVHAHLEPANPLRLGRHAAESQRRRATEAVTEGEVEP